MAVIEDLQTAKANIASQLATMMVSPKPSYSINGQSVSWDALYANLTDRLDKLNDLIAVEGGPYELRTAGSS